MERYSSLEYFERMRDEFTEMVKVAEGALGAFMQKLPADYRSRPLYEQPDAVWGERILPNLQWTLAGLNDGYIQLTHGEFAGLGMAGNVTTALAGMRRDYSYDWMPRHAQQRWEAHAFACSTPSFNIQITANGDWEQGDLTADFTDADRGPLNAPSTWPVYRLNTAIRVRSGDKVKCDGVYLPDSDHSAAQLLIKDYEAWEANVTTTTRRVSAERTCEPTTWTLVERVADSGGGIPGATDLVKAGVRVRCQGGKPCPLSGYWFTPARANSRRLFKTSELMPDVGGDYGVTIWQWDEQQ